MTDQPQPLDLDTIADLVAAIRTEYDESPMIFRANYDLHAVRLLPAAQQLLAELAKYVGHEPTIAEEMAYVQTENARLRAELEQARQRTETLAGIVALHLHTGWHLPKRTADEKTRAKWAAGEANALAAALHAAEINVFADHNPAAVSGA